MPELAVFYALDGRSGFASVVFQQSFRASLIMNRNHPRLSWPRPRGKHQVACHSCDALHQVSRIQEGDDALCSVCGSVLFRNRPKSLARASSYLISAMVFIVLLHCFPIVSMEAAGKQTDLTLIGAVRALFHHGDVALGLLFAVFTVCSPLILTLGMGYVILPLTMGLRFPGAVVVNVWIYKVKDWAMLEVFLLGFIVSLLKLGHIAALHYGIGLWSLIALVVSLAAAMSAVDNHELWDRLELAEDGNLQDLAK